MSEILFTEISSQCSEDGDFDSECRRSTSLRRHSLHRVFTHASNDSKKLPPRKGYLKTRWLLGHYMIDLVSTVASYPCHSVPEYPCSWQINVHLHHDADNTVALQARDGSESKYAIKRRDALLEALKAAHFDEDVPTYVFGFVKLTRVFPGSNSYLLQGLQLPT